VGEELAHWMEKIAAFNRELTRLRRELAALEGLAGE
jgi:hypothetical protein